MRIVAKEVAVKVPATSANLGPGYDSLGLALQYYDTVRLRATIGKTRVEIRGEGADRLPQDDSHLIVKTLRYCLDYVGAPQVGVDMRCENIIPQARGMGSSAAAIVAGIALAKGLIDYPEALNDEIMLRLATEFEGHPDNVAPAIYGGVVASGIEKDFPLAGKTGGKIQDLFTEAKEKETQESFRADSEQKVWSVPIVKTTSLPLTVLIPDYELSTKAARGLIPEQIPHEQAAANSANVALLVRALQDYPELLLSATRDYLHQDYRYSAMPPTLEMVYYLREQGYPAVVSGAGPTVLVFGKLPEVFSDSAENKGWKVKELSLDESGYQLEKLS